MSHKIGSMGKPVPLYDGRSGRSATASPCTTARRARSSSAPTRTDTCGLFRSYYQRRGKDGRAPGTTACYHTGDTGLARRGRLLLVCGPCGRRHQVLRLPHRAVRDRERHHGAALCAGMRRLRRARRGPRPGGQGQHRPDPAAPRAPRRSKKKFRTTSRSAPRRINIPRHRGLPRRAAQDHRAARSSAVDCKTNVKEARDHARKTRDAVCRALRQRQDQHRRQLRRVALTAAGPAGD